MRWGASLHRRPAAAPALAVAVVVMLAGGVGAAVTHRQPPPDAARPRALAPVTAGDRSPAAPGGPSPAAPVTATTTTGATSVLGDGPRTNPAGGERAVAGGADAERAPAAPATTTTTQAPQEAAGGPAACPAAPDGYPAWDRPDDTLCFRFEPDHTTVRQGETITGTLFIENRSNDDWQLTSPDGCHLQRGLFQGSDWVGGSPADEVCTQQQRVTEVPAGSTVALELEIDTLQRNGEGDGGDPGAERHPVPPGTYDAAAGHRVTTGDGPRIWWAPPVEVTVEEAGPLDGAVPPG